MIEGDSGSRTSVTLLGRLGQSPDDQAAWSQFVARYGPKIYGWCRQWHLQEADAEDVTQDVLLRLARKMRTFTYDRTLSFRGWLRTLTEHALSDFLACKRRPDPGSGDSATVGVLKTVAAREDLVLRLQAEFDHEVLEEATLRVRLRVEPRTWEAFQLTAVDGMSGDAVAAQLGMRVTAVFKAKSRVQKMLQQAIAKLESGS